MKTLILVIVVSSASLSWTQGLLDRLKRKAPDEAEQIGIQVVPRDAFPVFDHPEFVAADMAEKKGYVHDRDPVIGVVIGGEAKAYPIRTMGIHELGNDTLGGIPIAVSW